MNYSDEIQQDLSESDEPKYKLRLRTAERSVEKKISTAQVQFWPYYMSEFIDSIMEKSNGTSSLPEIIRVDLMTNSYYPDWIMQLK